MLTTHYLEEADNLAGQVVIVDQGMVVAQEARRLNLSARSPATRSCSPQVRQVRRWATSRRALPPATSCKRVPRIEGDALRLYVDNGATALPLILAVLSEGGFNLAHISLSQPSLDDVFLRRRVAHCVTKSPWRRKRNRESYAIPP